MEIVGLDLVAAEVLHRAEPCGLDGHLDGASDLGQRHSVSDELGNGVPGALGDLHEVPVGVGADLDGPGGVADVPVQLRTAVHFDHVADLEHLLVGAARRVMRGDLVDADVAGECEAASVLADVTLYLLCDIVQLHAFFYHGEAQLSGLSRYPSRSTELLKPLFAQHCKTSLILSAGMAPCLTISTSLSISQTMVEGCPMVQEPASM